MKRIPKFKDGDLVMVGKLSCMQSHFPQNCLAIVNYHSSSKFSCRFIDAYSLFIVAQPGIEDWDTGSSSWYDEKDLTLVA
jgi:hypothetical protein